jgi:Tol biopolymer transport system component
LNVYPLVPNSTQAEIQCTSAMLAICGNALSASVDPSGKYIFFVNDSYGNEITQMDVANNRLIDTGESLPNQVAKFSPDGTLAYTLNVSGGSYAVQIYGFDSANGAITTNGGTISGSSISDSFWPVLRQ